MTTQIYWQLDTSAEPWRGEPALRAGLPELVRDLRRPTQNRFDYYAQVAVAAEQTAFDGLFLPHRREADDSRIVAATLAREVPRLKLLAEFPASVGSAVYAAKQAVTFQRAAQDRLEWAIAPDGDAAARAAEGDFVDEDELVARRGEFLTVSRGVHGTPGFTFKGKHFEVEAGGFADPLSRARFPLVVHQGETEEDLALSASLADVHLLRASAPEHLASLIEGIDALAKAAGRQIGFALWQPVLARETADEAQRDFARSGLPAETLVGSWDEVAERLAGLSRLGFGRLILATDQQLEGAYAVGQQVLPPLRALLATTAKAA